MKTHFSLGHSSSFIVIFITSVMMMVSCGIEDSPSLAPRPATVAPTTNLLIEEGGCSESVTPVTTELKNEVQDFYDEVEAFINSYNSAFVPYMTYPRSVGTGDNLMATPLNPLILNTDVLRADLASLKSKWREMTSPNIEGAVSLQRIESLEGFTPLFQELNSLLISSQRLQGLSCQREELELRADKDVRLYYSYLKGESDISMLCAQGSTEDMCLMEKRMLERQGNLNLYVENYERQFKEKVASFFAFSKASEWNCIQHQGKRALVVPLIFDNRLQNKIGNVIANFNFQVAHKWQKEDFKVTFVPFDKNIHSQGLEIKWTETFLSFVEKDNPLVIHLSPYLNFESTLLTIAHELGHTFGFPDCYQEFYEKKSKSIIYYSLDETGTNLMCNLGIGASIPDRYLEKLEAANCQ